MSKGNSISGCIIVCCPSKFLYKQRFKQERKESKMAEKSSGNQDTAAQCEESNETLIHSVSKECAAKNAWELVQEEEREKQRAEKRKAKKQRRKEKKKEKQLQLNKNSNKNSNEDSNSDNNKNSASEDNNVTKQKKKGHLKGNSSEVKNKQSEEEAESENERFEEDGFLDLNSAFVNAANKNKQKPVTKPHRKKTDNVEDSTTEEGEKLALQGFIAAKNRQYQEAVDLFTKAINIIKNDYRFYSNRSFCYCQLGQFTKGLKDADKCIRCSPNNPKGYFRRGEALKNLKQYKEAEEAFLKALQIDDSIVEARQELDSIKVQQLLDMGFKLHEAEAALQEHSTVQAAVEALSISKDESSEDEDDDDEDEIFYSDDELESAIANSKCKIDLLNPLGLSSLWVGNITESVTEIQLQEIFSRYGEITNIKLLPQSFCAFINYKDKSSPGPAMRGLQGIFIGGQHLIIRFPNNAATDTQQKALLAASTNHLKAKGPVNSNECHFWRTTGCAFGDKCRYVHIEEHKGIDKKPWQKAPEL